MCQLMIFFMNRYNPPIRMAIVEVSPKEPLTSPQNISKYPGIPAEVIIWVTVCPFFSPPLSMPSGVAPVNDSTEVMVALHPDICPGKQINSNKLPVKAGLNL